MSSSLDAARERVIQSVKIDLLSKTQAAENESKRKEIARSFISDTITVPTVEMYAYAVNATLGDDVYSEPSTTALEAHIAKLTGKEAGIFMPSGTASNQIALRTHLKQPPYTVLCDHRSHIYRYEVGGTPFHSGAAMTTLIPSNGTDISCLYVRELISRRKAIISLCRRWKTMCLNSAPTEVISLENTLNGTIFPQDEIIAISKFARSHDIKTHLDGARLWHVAVETGLSMKELCDPFDSVSLCFSKGLGAPIGSCLVGQKEYIAKARRFRKLFGGGMRQTGILVASAAYALNNNFPLLVNVHTLARKVQKGLEDIGVTILSPAETCMVFYDASSIGTTFDEIFERGKSLPEPLILGGSRVVIHIQTSEAAVDDFLALIGDIAEEKKRAGFVKPEINGQGRIKDFYVRRH
ncbi:pyridoxal phosphate-dependent transferase [Armillaria borealis]|uniref:Pyridoxal phosphate-dependent transferase n=1 Tax=Armillaria borealis TaxID=47425 RepID=A0AA39K828_9AGAR|nr:pyridoxal phosphate-dependent transferase [Armillaria borealis]